VVEEGIALEDHHHQVTPAGVCGEAGVEDNVHEGTDVEDGRCLEVKTGDDGLLIGRCSRRCVRGTRRRSRHKLASGDGGLLQGGCCLLLQEGACGLGMTACSHRLLLGFLGVLDESVEFGLEGGGGVSRCSTHAGAEVENLATGPGGAATWGRRPGEAAVGGSGLLWWWPEGRLPRDGSQGAPGLGLG
jgi:hypothetical protein